MPQLMNPFNPMDHNLQTGIGQFPVSDGSGWKMRVISSDLKENSKKSGGFIEYICEIIDGDFAGQTGAIRFNSYHNNPDAVRIADEQHATFCCACGFHGVMTATEQIHGYQFVGIVQQQKNNPEYTEVKKYKTIEGNDPTKEPQGHQGGNPAQWSAPPAQEQAPPPPTQEQAPPPAWGNNQPPQEQSATPKPPWVK